MHRLKHVAQSHSFLSQIWYMVVVTLVDSGDYISLYIIYSWKYQFKNALAGSACMDNITSFLALG